MMLLERRLVSKLEDYTVSHDSRTELVNFVEYIPRTIWPRWNYLFYSKRKFTKKIRHILDDCIEEKYIDKSCVEELSVTRKGRNFISWSGFCEEFYRRRKRFTTVLFSSTLSSILTGLIVYFWSAISVIFK